MITPLYLEYAGGNYVCPSGWLDAGAGLNVTANGQNTVRACLPPTGSTCSILYLESTGTPASCPSLWTDYGSLTWFFTGGGGNVKRYCLKC